ncbi:tetrathionate reductase family octaheme c-type cytochrome [bacterium]|nr:tetrathionate reductase family octaheme c-type cytochrome [bacterium]
MVIKVQNSQGAWLFARLSGVLLAGWVLIAAGCSQSPPPDDPWARMPLVKAHTDHAELIPGPLATPQDATRECLVCHADAGAEVLNISHWTWQSDEVEVPWLAEPLKIGKKNMINNFCIATPSNLERCASCHIGYGWKDDGFDFSNPENIDCLICHDQTGGYKKDPNGAGLPAEGVDLLAAAQSVARPSRDNCGACHFAGGGGDAVKHGDMDATMKHPSSRIDVHMGKHGFVCVDCHRTEQHQIPGLLPSVRMRDDQRVFCTDCHAQEPHGDQRLDMHTATVACQACHIPYYAVEAETKLSWDWSSAGLDEEPEDYYFDIGETRHYLKEKGSFTYGRRLVPEYFWFDGRVKLYLPGQPIDPAEITRLNCPEGAIDRSRAKLMPFKKHHGRQAYDVRHRYLLVPKLYGPGGFWEDFDWQQSFTLGAQASGRPFSGEYAWTETEMCWPITHMVQPAEHALQCTDCHGPEAKRLDWQQLGYTGDPAYRGTRAQTGLIAGEEVQP